MNRTRSRHLAVIRRPRLLRLIDGEHLAPVTLIIAPAGYGKSILIEQWARSTCLRVASVALGADANSLPVFLSRLATAIDRAFGDKPPRSPSTVTLDDVLARLDEVAESGPGLALVLDDIHLVENRDVHQAMDALIASLPSAVHLIVASRTVPPLTLGRRRLAGQVRTLSGDDLSFAPAETAALMPLTLSTRLSEDQVTRLVERTGGWIAGIRFALAVLESRDHNAIDQALDELPDHPWLDDYLVEEVLDRLPEDLRDFVLRSVHLPWLEPRLCDHALGIRDSARLLRDVKRHILFLRPGEEPGTIAYHALFADCVRRIAARSLALDTWQAVHRRAATWFEQAGNLEQALDQSLAAEAWTHAQRLARDLCRPLMDSDHHHSRLHWLRRLPEPLVLADPELARAYISALQYTGNLRAARAAFEQVEPGWLASGDPVQRGFSCSCRAFFAVIAGEPEVSLQHCYEALACYPLARTGERLHLWNGIIQVEFQRGNDDVASQAFRQAEVCREHLPAVQRWWTLAFEPDRANHQALRGNLRGAANMYEMYLARLPGIFRGSASKLRSRLAAIYLEWNEIERADAECTQFERDLEDFPHDLWYPEVLMVVARVAEAMGDTAKLEATLHRVREMSRMGGGQVFIDRLDAHQAMVWLEAGNLDLAREWARAARLRDFGWVRIAGDLDPRLAIARVDIADGSHQAARDRLQELIDQAIETKRWAELVPLAVWHVVACLALDDEAAALEALRLALRHGREGGFVRSFLTPGYDIGPFLHRARVHLGEEEATWLQHLLDQGVWRMPVASPTVRKLVMPGHSLSLRELEVLCLLQRGLPNRAIATELYVSEHTVKKHVRAILSKLGATNRTNAVVIARDQGLLT